jgi:hypothetical protein
MNLNHVFEYISNKANVLDNLHTIHNALDALFQQRNKYLLPCSFLHSKLTAHVLPRNGDLVVGFVATEDVSFTLSIGGVEICKHDLQKNEFVYAIDNEFIIPQICLAFQEVRVSEFEHIDVVYAALHDEDRYYMAQNPWFSYPVQSSENPSQKYLYYKCGVAKKCDSPPDAFEIPQVNSLPFTDSVLKKKF